MLNRQIISRRRLPEVMRDLWEIFEAGELSAAMAEVSEAIDHRAYEAEGFFFKRDMSTFHEKLWLCSIGELDNDHRSDSWSDEHKFICETLKSAYHESVEDVAIRAIKRFAAKLRKPAPRIARRRTG